MTYSKPLKLPSFRGFLFVPDLWLGQWMYSAVKAHSWTPDYRFHGSRKDEDTVVNKHASIVVGKKALSSFNALLPSQ